MNVAGPPFRHHQADFIFEIVTACPGHPELLGQHANVFRMYARGDPLEGDDRVGVEPEDTAELRGERELVPVDTPGEGPRPGPRGPLDDGIGLPTFASGTCSRIAPADTARAPQSAQSRRRLRM
jgi:hypothetical protein